jgi:hypothetical protein
VRSEGTLTQYDAQGIHLLGGGVASAGIAFAPFVPGASGPGAALLSEVALVLSQGGTLTQFDATGTLVLGTVP